MKNAIQTTACVVDKRTNLVPQRLERSKKGSFFAKTFRITKAHNGLFDEYFEEEGSTKYKNTLQSGFVSIFSPQPQSEIALVEKDSGLLFQHNNGTRESLIDQLSTKKIIVKAMNNMTRLSRSQILDILKSMANTLSYMADIEDTNLFNGLSCQGSRC